MHARTHPHPQTASSPVQPQHDRIKEDDGCIGKTEPWCNDEAQAARAEGVPHASKGEGGLLLMHLFQLLECQLV